MRTRFFATKPDDMEFTIQMTMPLSQWKELRDAVADKWPGWELRSAITDVVLQAEKVFAPKTADEE